MWTKIHLTPLDKILVIKTLATSEITHLVITLSDPPEQFFHELDALFYQFPWDDKKQS